MALTASSSRGGGGGETRERSEPVLSTQWKKWKGREISPERTPVWTESHHTSGTVKPRSNNGKLVESRDLLSVPVVYYISRNGQLEHPHFMEIPLSSSHGLLLRDFINRLNLLRGKCMASRYSWSAKRSYRNGYVWHDLEENDLIQPVNGQEYVLKGSEILLPHSSTSSAITSNSSCLISKSSTESSSSFDQQLETETLAKSGELRPDPFPFSRNNNRRRRNQSCSSVDLHEYKVYKAELNGNNSNGKSVAAADAGTQTEDKQQQQRRHRQRKQHVIIEEEQLAVAAAAAKTEQSTELCREEISVSISPPPSESSPETLESLMKSDGKVMLSCSRDLEHPVAAAAAAGDTPYPSGKLKASSVLMSLISCGSMSFRDCTAGAGVVKDHEFSLVSHYKGRLSTPRSGKDSETGVDQSSCNISVASNSFSKMALLEDKEYFSGSLIETKRKDDEFATVLKRSSSFNADHRSSSTDLKLGENDEDGGGVGAMCIRKLKIIAKGQARETSSSAPSAKKETSGNATIPLDNSDKGTTNAR